MTAIVIANITTDSGDSDDSDGHDDKHSNNTAVVKFDLGEDCYYVDCDEHYDVHVYYALLDSDGYCDNKKCRGSCD
jgi:hypothetical protein